MNTERKEKIVAIIPARSGSKGLKDKNIKILNGKPLIAYTIEAAKESCVFDRIIVSTDSEKYAEIAIQYGAEVPFLRSSDNSKDNSTSWAVVKEVLANLDEKYDIVALLQPTSPLRTSEDIKNAAELFFNKNAETLFSVCETTHSMFWCSTLNEDLSAKDFIKKEYQIPRQKLPKTYTLNGAIYLVKTDLIDNLNLYGDKGFAYIMDKSHSVDIDDEIDFSIAELILKSR